MSRVSMYMKYLWMAYCRNNSKIALTLDAIKDPKPCTIEDIFPKEKPDDKRNSKDHKV